MFKKLVNAISGHPQNNEFQKFIDDGKQFIQQAQEGAKELQKNRQMLEIMAHHLGGYVWIKRWDLLEETYFYEFANKPHCRAFFGIPEDKIDECVEKIKGRHDIDLLSEFRERTGLRHTYGDLCFSTDLHAVEQAIKFFHTDGKEGAKSCSYLECGFVGDNQLLLEVTKTPLFVTGSIPQMETHTYSIGSACDVSNLCESRLEFARSAVERGEAERLDKGVFWLFPKPENCDLLHEELK